MSVIMRQIVFVCWCLLHNTLATTVALKADESMEAPTKSDGGDQLKDGLWLSFRLTSHSFDGSCFSGGCSEPRLRVIISDLRNEQRKTASWRIDEKRRRLVIRTAADELDYADDFVIFAPRHDREALFKMEIVGRDPTYNFPRICDASTTVQPFLADFSRSVTLDLDAGCFNASALLRMYCCETYCYRHPFLTPWCDMDETQRTVAMAKSFSVDDESSGGGAAPLWVVVLLSFLVFGLMLMLVTSLTLQLRKRKGETPSFWKNRPSLKRNSNGGTLAPAPPPHALYRSASQESKYDAPWDQKFRPLPHRLRSEIRGVGLATSASSDGASSTRQNNNPRHSPPPTGDVASTSAFHHRAAAGGIDAASCLDVV